MSSDDIMGGVAVTLIFVVIFYILYDVYKNQQGSITTYILTLAIVALTFVVLFGDWLWFRRGQQVNLLSGISGTQIGAPVQEYGGYETRYVSFERKMVPREKRKQIEGVLYWVKNFFTATIVVPITAKRSLWEEVPDYDSENPNGAVFFRGRIDGGDLRNPDILLGIKQIERQSRIISYIQTAAAQMEEQLSAIANQKIYDAEKMSQHLKLIGDNVKHITVVTGKGGSGGIEAAAGEMSG